MAVRKAPVWDMSFEQIEARARGIKLDRDYFARAEPQQVRADSVSEADREALRAAVGGMSADQVLAYSAALARGEKPDVIDFISARADSVPQRDGLEMHTRFDDTGRKIREFTSLTGRKDWMDDFKKPLFLMIRLNKENQTPKQRDRFEREWRDTNARVTADIAAGRTPTCDLTVPMSDD